MVEADINALMAANALNGAQIEVKPFQTLLMHFAHENGADMVIRGLRAVSDFEYEFQMAANNKRIYPRIETVFLMASETSQFISSRFVKEIHHLGGDVSSFVTRSVLDHAATASAARARRDRLTRLPDLSPNLASTDLSQPPARTAPSCRPPCSSPICASPSAGWTSSIRTAPAA